MMLKKNLTEQLKHQEDVLQYDCNRGERLNLTPLKQKMEVFLSSERAKEKVLEGLDVRVKVGQCDLAICVC